MAHDNESLRSEGPRSREPVFGIDLGTTNCCVAAVVKGTPRVIPIEGAYETMPAVVFITPQKKVLVGRKAVERMVMFPDRSIYGSKRFVGRAFASTEVRSFGHFFRYELTAGRTGLVAARIGGTVVPLEVVAAYILAHIRHSVSAQLGHPMKKAVITVPAYFGERQRQAVKEAARLAGLELERIINEPTAGAVAYGYGRGLNKTILVYDLGGGTFDASVLRINGDQMDVLATAGGPFLGGSDFDDRLTEYVLMNVEKEHQVSLRDNPVALQRLRFAAEQAKQELSDAPVATIDLPYLAETDQGQLNIKVDVQRAMLDSITTDLVTQTFEIVQRALDAAKLTGKQLDDVIMIGGQSRSPLVRQMLAERFGQQPARNIHPDHAVAMGAALVGSAKYDAVPVHLTDVLSGSVRLGQPDGSTRVLLTKNTSLPASVEFGVSTITDQHGAEFRVPLYRGEETAAEKNEPLGMIRLPSNFALAVTKVDAPVTLRINAQGLMTVSVTHPMTKQHRELEIVLTGEASDDEILEVDESMMMAG